jgi:hypothetical protein
MGRSAGTVFSNVRKKTMKYILADIGLTAAEIMILAGGACILLGEAILAF